MNETCRKALRALVNAVKTYQFTPEDTPEKGMASADLDDAVDAAKAALHSPSSNDEARPISQCANEEMAQNAKRYMRLRILGVAPAYTGHLERGEVMRFTNLDEFVDRDIGLQPRGEA